MDGWGVAPDNDGNAVTRAKLPNISNYIKHYPVATLLASGSEVGLSFGEVGNSEVGHLNIGAGRVYYQTLPRINIEIENGNFFQNQHLLSALEHSNKNNSQLHLMGLVSEGNVHSSLNHIFALLDLLKKNKFKQDVFIHAFLDGRDCLYNSGKIFIDKLEKKMKEVGIGKVASLSGRYYAMDRDNHWDRTEKAYKAMVMGVGERTAISAAEAIEKAYAEENYDEEFLPTVVTGRGGKPVGVIEENDAVIFFNYRPDRARQITKSFVLPTFNKFEVKFFSNLKFVTMTEYEKELPVDVAYPTVSVINGLSETISKAGLTQFHLAETEKYAHITFFLNGTKEEPFPGEDRLIIPSPKVSSYDQQSEMFSMKVVKEAVKAIESGVYDFMVINFANADMVGHTGNLEATIKACEAVDAALGTVVDHALAKGGAVVVTADHGNGEEVVNLQTGEKDKEHSTNPVPLFMIAQDLIGQAGPSGDPPEGDLSLLPPAGMLADVAPTVLTLMGLEQPPEMTGRSLI